MSGVTECMLYERLDLLYKPVLDVSGWLKLHIVTYYVRQTPATSSGGRILRKRQRVGSELQLALSQMISHAGSASEKRNTKKFNIKL